MTKIAYLIGASGSGKGFIAKQLEKDVKLIIVDWLHHRAADRLSRTDVRPWYNWERWDDHLRTLDVVPTFAELLAELWPDLTADRPILAEGVILAHDRWREAFRSALVRRGIPVTDERIFWIDPLPTCCGSSGGKEAGRTSRMKPWRPSRCTGTGSVSESMPMRSAATRTQEKPCGRYSSTSCHEVTNAFTTCPRPARMPRAACCPCLVRGGSRP